MLLKQNRGVKLTRSRVSSFVQFTKQGVKFNKRLRGQIWGPQPQSPPFLPTACMYIPVQGESRLLRLSTGTLFFENQVCIEIILKLFWNLLSACGAQYHFESMGLAKKICQNQANRFNGAMGPPYLASQSFVEFYPLFCHLIVASQPNPTFGSILPPILL